ILGPTDKLVYPVLLAVQPCFHPHWHKKRWFLHALFAIDSCCTGHREHSAPVFRLPHNPVTAYAGRQTSLTNKVRAMKISSIALGAALLMPALLGSSNADAGQRQSLLVNAI